ncbi:hypothetical protein C8Q80DRAFT_124870 [Daedaleopsis nitida]|nr:hypothetical protein C8Q80DRAFT_124870 [Daedaleopsis nitida]
MFQARHAIFVLVQLVLDSFVNYRCWVVWQKNYWVIAFPVLLSFISSGCGFFKVWSFSGLPNQSPASQVAWIKAFLSLSLIANALATSLLAFRIWFTDRNTHNAIPGHTSSFLPIARIVLESGMMNAAYLFAEMMVITFDPTATEFMCDLGPAVAGIIFFVVILRISHRRPDNTVYALSSWKTLDRSHSPKTQAHIEPSSSIADEGSSESRR